MFLHMFPQIRLVKFISSQRLPEHRAGTAWMHEETVSIIHKKLGDVLTADHKVFNSERSNLFRTIVTQSWCRTFILT